MLRKIITGLSPEGAVSRAHRQPLNGRINRLSPKGAAAGHTGSPLNGRIQQAFAWRERMAAARTVGYNHMGIEGICFIVGMGSVLLALPALSFIAWLIRRGK